MKIKAAVLALLFCITLSSCGKAESDEVLLTEQIETEATVSETTEKAEIPAETSAESVTEVTEQPDELTKTEETAETAKNDITNISHINFNYFYGKDNSYKYFDISARNSLVYVIAFGGSDSTEYGFITDKQFAKITESVNSSGISEFYGTDNSDEQAASLLLDACTVTITDADGNKYFATRRGDIPEAFTELDKVLNEYAGNAYCGEDPSAFASAGIENAVDAQVYFRSYLRKCFDLGEDCSAYAGQSMIIDSSDLNPLDSDMFCLPDDWNGYAYVKFNADGTDVEYVNWAETKEALSENELTYEELEAYYIENKTIIGTTGFAD